MFTINLVTIKIYNLSVYLGVSKNRATPKWMVYKGKPYENGWFGGKNPIFGNIHLLAVSIVFHPLAFTHNSMGTFHPHSKDGGPRKQLDWDLCGAVASEPPTTVVVILSFFVRKVIRKRGSSFLKK